MKYTFYPSLACILDVECDGFPVLYGVPRTTFIFMAEGRPIACGIASKVEFNNLPLAVQNEINTHFATVFDLPIEDRIEYMKRMKPWSITAEEYTHA